MASIAITSHISSPFTSFNPSQTFPKHASISSHPQLHARPTLSFSPLIRTLSSTPKATLDQQIAPDEPADTKVDVGESLKVLKNAAKTRKVKAEEVLEALSVIKKANIDSSAFLQTLGGTESPGRTWMLIFTSQDGMKRGSYFPLTAIQRFDAAAKRIENGVYLGSIGCLTFEGKFSWKKRILAFVFEYIKLKLGPFGPFQISLGSQDKEPSTKDPFFIWFYVDEEIAVAQGKGGGTAFWCRCNRMT